MASETPLKGILKNAVHGKTAAAARPDPRAVAIQHARILQQRKDLELQILLSIETLSQLPLQRGTRFSATHPSPSDVAEFKTHVRLFQPGDYDDLIEERGANHLCGYTLCPNPKPRASPGGQWKLVDVGKPSFSIVDRKESERWCSELCKKRALYVKVQLSETAAWERIGMPDIQIDLYQEESSSESQTKDPATSTAEGLAKLNLDDDKTLQEQAASLTRKRGDANDAATRLSELTIREKSVGPPGDVEADTAYSSANTPDTSLAIEGYIPGTIKVQDDGAEDEPL